jgi:hypothetical protein
MGGTKIRLHAPVKAGPAQPESSAEHHLPLALPRAALPAALGQDRTAVDSHFSR